MKEPRTALIRALNDQLRQKRGEGRLVATAGVVSKGASFVAAALCAVAAADEFDEANDPWDEHDFGEAVVSGVRLFWKIGYYDATLEHGVEDPADALTCRRVLTIMLVEEY